MRTVKSVLIVTRMGYVEGVFTSFRALANSQGATRINIEGEYEDEFGFHYMKMDKLPGEGPTYMEPISFEKKINPQLYPGSHHSTAVFRGRKICLCAQLKICPRGWLVERQSRSSGMAGKDPGL